jgi:hypothetical protein
MLVVKQELLTLLEQLSSHPLFSGVRYGRLHITDSDYYFGIVKVFLVP